MTEKLHVVLPVVVELKTCIMTFQHKVRYIDIAAEAVVGHCCVLHARPLRVARGQLFLLGCFFSSRTLTLSYNFVMLENISGKSLSLMFLQKFTMSRTVIFW